MKRPIVLLVGVCLLAPIAAHAQKQTGQPDHSLIRLLSEELDYARQNLVLPDGTRPYFLSYTITDDHSVAMAATLGSISRDAEERARYLDVDARVGDYQLDNTHKLRDDGWGFDSEDLMFRGPNRVSLEDDPTAVKQALWLATDRAVKSAAKKYQRVLTNLKTKVEEDDKSDDFSREEPSIYAEPEAKLRLDTSRWASQLREVSALAREYPLIYDSSVTLDASAENRFMVTSEGTRLQHGRKLLRVMVYAATKAEDGMELSQQQIFDSASDDGLPGVEEMRSAFRQVIEQVLALREAPLVEPYTGPAILRNRAAGVYFHEIFGHRIEGHRQKDVDEGQTFTKKLGEEVLPDFLNVRDDPTLARFGNTDLRGHYKFDDEGTPAENARLIENGVLKTFLMSRSPVENAPESNGHGRRSPGNGIAARQGNLIIESSRTASFDQLRQMLIDECKRQGKPYGLLFEDITGGFTSTQRYGPQAYKVLPVVVYRVHADGRPDELVRGVDIVGTPLTGFSKITYTGDDPGIFNGTCGAESGWVPVSAISPSLLLSEIEIEKRRREQDKPPILPPPIAEGSTH